MYTLRKSALFALLVLFLSLPEAGAVQIGFGPGIGTGVDGAGSRLNVDESFATLPAGVYDVQDFAFNSGGTTGTATPFLATSPSSDTYVTLWVGPGFAPGATGVQADAYAPKSELFYLPTATNVYAGFAQDAPLVRFDDPGPAGNTDHDGSFTTPTGPGQTVSGFSNANLPRNYGFAMNVADLGPYATVNAHITADDSYELYFSLDENEAGFLVGSGSGWETPEDFTFLIPMFEPVYFHIVGHNGGVSPSGVLAQFELTDATYADSGDSLLITDGAWDASTVGFSGAMSAATDLGANGISPWGTRPGYDTTDVPHWIWLGSGNRPAGEAVFLSFQLTAVPEPSTLAMLLGLGGFGLWTLIRRRRKN